MMFVGIVKAILAFCHFSLCTPDVKHNNCEGFGLPVPVITKISNIEHIGIKQEVLF